VLSITVIELTYSSTVVKSHTIVVGMEVSSFESLSAHRVDATVCDGRGTVSDDRSYS
jgi:hypothetical protein